MESLDPADLRKLLDAVYALGLVSNMIDLPIEAARIVYELVPCDHSGWIVLDFAAGRMDGVHWPNDIAHLFEQVPQDLATVPLVPAAALGPTTTVIRLSDFLSKRDLHNTRIYSDLYRLIGVEYQVVVPLAFGVPSSGLGGKRAESLTLARHDADFTDRERNMLGEFGRHVRSTARRLRIRATAPTSQSIQRFGLTARQGESLLAIADGASVRAAAKTLDVAPKTLENHLQAAYARLGVSNRVAALARVRSGQAGDFGLGEIPR
ncbi:MAG: LuxR C-terminal-related transcriptional regulator [Pseudolysinimonas sp.]